jgi:hypothetical protein
VRIMSFEKFTNLVEQIEHCGRSVGNDPARLEAITAVDYPKKVFLKTCQMQNRIRL